MSFTPVRAELLLTVHAELLLPFMVSLSNQNGISS
jgi:hypothetical protein